MMLWQTKMNMHASMNGPVKWGHNDDDKWLNDKSEWMNGYLAGRSCLTSQLRMFLGRWPQVKLKAMTEAARWQSGPIDRKHRERVIQPTNELMTCIRARHASYLVAHIVCVLCWWFVIVLDCVCNSWIVCILFFPQ